MKKLTFVFAVVCTFLLSGNIMAQEWRTFTWDSYKTEFKIPSDFEVTESTGEKFSATNEAILMAIFPAKDENLAWDEMEEALIAWSLENEVENMADVVELDEEKMNGYWGMMLEGTKSDFNVATMLLVDPDYPEISLYIWVAYDTGLEDTVLEMLMSISPM